MVRSQLTTKVLTPQTLIQIPFSLDKNSNTETLEDEGFAEFESMDMATLNKELENLITQEPTKALKDKVEAIKKSLQFKI